MINRIPLPVVSLISALALMLSLPATADQTDNRLDPLFTALRKAPDAATAAAIEQKIWIVWIKGPNEEADALMLEGMEALKREELELALKRFTELVKKEPNFAEAWNKRATVHFLMDNYTKALSDLEETLKLEPRHFGALSGLGTIFAELDQPHPAIQVFERVLEIHPNAKGVKQRIRKLEELVKGRTI